MKTGIVLEGGAMRGLFTAGVIDVLMENGIEFEACAGVSAGVAFGCNLKSRQIGRVVRYNTRFARNWRYCSLLSLLLTGNLYGAKFCYDTMPNRLDPFDWETFQRNPLRFYAVCTDADTGKAVYTELKTGRGEDMDWMRASASMPVASRAVKIGGRRYLDGGIVDSVPLRFMENIGFDANVVVLTQPSGYKKEPMRHAAALRAALWRYPNVFAALKKRPETYNDQISYVETREKQGKAFVIRPPQRLPVGHVEHNPKKLRQAYEIGRAEMSKRLDELKSFLQEKQ